MNQNTIMHISVASSGGRPLGNSTGLVGDLHQTFAPETRALECFCLFGKTSRGQLMGFAYALLSQGPAVTILWHGKTPGISTKRRQQMERKNIPFVCYNCPTREVLNATLTLLYYKSKQRNSMLLSIMLHIICLSLK